MNFDFHLIHLVYGQFFVMTVYAIKIHVDLTSCVSEKNNFSQRAMVKCNLDLFIILFSYFFAP